MRAAPWPPRAPGRHRPLLGKQLRNSPLGLIGTLALPIGTGALVIGPPVCGLELFGQRPDNLPDSLPDSREDIWRMTGPVSAGMSSGIAGTCRPRLVGGGQAPGQSRHCPLVSTSDGAVPAARPTWRISPGLTLSPRMSYCDGRHPGQPA